MSNKPLILLAEDEIALGTIVKESLETRGFEVLFAENGSQAKMLFEQQNPDLLVLDVMMPEMDGFHLASLIRKRNKTVPIIFLTSKSQPEDVVKGFHHGANDYLKKPFSMEELIVRINALLDRLKLKQNQEQIRIGQYIFNHPRQLLIFQNKETVLTHKEAELLLMLAENANEVTDKSQALQKIWGDDDFFAGRSLDVFITRLRSKLKQDPDIQILNIRGVGYKLVCY